MIIWYGKENEPQRKSVFQISEYLIVSLDLISEFNSNQKLKKKKFQFFRRRAGGDGRNRLVIQADRGVVPGGDHKLAHDRGVVPGTVVQLDPAEPGSLGQGAGRPEPA